jgi:hypothetical protein
MKDEDTALDKRSGGKALLISESLFKLDGNGKIVVNRLHEMDEALKNIRVADPAVGSGAFPLGMLNEIVRARQTITEYLTFEQREKAVSKKQSWFLIRQLKNSRSAYELKRQAIKDSIFAVDIEPSAVDIAQLRLWLSLVIDDEINPNATNELEGHRDPLPLPNLECNILCGNSLVDEFEGIPLINQSDLIGTAQDVQQQNMYQSSFDYILEKLIGAQDRLFKCDDPVKKQQLLEEIASLRNEIVMSQLEGKATTEIIERYEATKTLASKPYILWQLDFARVFREKGGFDVVIGNPPYIGFQKVPNKEYNKKHYYSADGKYDFYVLFIERGLQLVSPGGFVSFICPSYFYKRNYGKHTRELMLRKSAIRYIADFSDYQIFETALTYTCIFGMQKTVSSNNKVRILNKSLSLQGSYDVEQTSLTEPSWILEKSDTNMVLQKVQNAACHVFGEITKSISQGIVTGNNDVFLIPNEVIEELELETELLKTAYKGKDVGEGQLHNSEYKVFYPYYLNSKGKTVCISEEKLKECAPNLYFYLLNKKDVLLSRDYFVKSNKVWYELWNPRKMEHFYNRKFVFSEIGLVNDFVLVDECFYTDSVCGAELKAEYKPYEMFIYRFLNSQLATYVYKKISVPKANGYSIYKNAFLKGMPILLPTDKLDFGAMSKQEFNDYLYKIIKLTPGEIEMVENAKFSQA